MTENATFLLPRYRPKLVHGSFFTKSFWTLRTNVSRTILHINTSAETTGFDVRFADMSLASSKRGMWKEYVLEDVRVYYKYATLFVRCAGWETNVTRRQVFNSIAGPQWRFDVAMQPLNGTGFEWRHGYTSGVVAAHGILGQSWDGDDVAVDGATDDYGGLNAEMWTTAMAEGAIEGDAADYVLASPYSTTFKYSRFDTTAPTSPRNVAMLRGAKRARTPSLYASSNDDDMWLLANGGAPIQQAA
jgi:hypothetical protein